jgi:hypothetical protein
MAITILVVLAIRHGHTGFDALVLSAVVIAALSSPLITSVRVRCGDRTLALRALRLMPEFGDELKGVSVLHDFGLPRALGTPESWAADLDAIGTALTIGTIPTCIAQPCCEEVGAVFASWGRGLLVPPHTQAEHSVIAFPVVRNVATVGQDHGEIVSIDRARRSPRRSFESSSR